MQACSGTTDGDYKREIPSSGRVLWSSLLLSISHPKLSSCSPVSPQPPQSKAKKRLPWAQTKWKERSGKWEETGLLPLQHVQENTAELHRMLFPESSPHSKASLGAVPYLAGYLVRPLFVGHASCTAELASRLAARRKGSQAERQLCVK